MTNEMNQPFPLRLMLLSQATIAQPTPPGSSLISSTSTVQSKPVLLENSEYNLINSYSCHLTPVSDNISDNDKD